MPEKRTRSCSSTSEATEAPCFFCGEPPGDAGELHEAFTFEVDRCVRTSATLTEDTEVWGKLSGGDMIALESKYHAKYLAALYKERTAEKVKEPGSDEEKMLPGLAFAELVMYTEEILFKLAHLVHLYGTRRKQFGVEMKVRSTRLKVYSSAVPRHVSP